MPGSWRWSIVCRLLVHHLVKFEAQEKNGPCQLCQERVNATGLRCECDWWQILLPYGHCALLTNSSDDGMRQGTRFEDGLPHHRHQNDHEGWLRASTIPWLWGRGGPAILPKYVSLHAHFKWSSHLRSRDFNRVTLSSKWVQVIVRPAMHWHREHR